MVARSRAAAGRADGPTRWRRAPRRRRRPVNLPRRPRRPASSSAPRGRATRTPYPQARIRLRNVETGRAVARTIGDGDGRFRFERVDPGAYVVELLSGEDKVLAVGDLFGVLAGGQATTLVRLSSKAPWVAGFFGNAAAAAIAAASTLGVTAVGSNGQSGECAVGPDAPPCSTCRIFSRRPGRPSPPRVARSRRVDSRSTCWIG